MELCSVALSAGRSLRSVGSAVAYQYVLQLLDVRQILLFALVKTLHILVARFVRLDVIVVLLVEMIIAGDDILWTVSASARLDGGLVTLHLPR